MVVVLSCSEKRGFPGHLAPDHRFFETLQASLLQAKLFQFFFPGSSFQSFHSSLLRILSFPHFAMPGVEGTALPPPSAASRSPGSGSAAWLGYRRARAHVTGGLFSATVSYSGHCPLVVYAARFSSYLLPFLHIRCWVCF